MIRVKLTNRDIQLMYDLYNNVFLSFEQIRREHFKKCATSTVYNRLSKLIKANLVESLNVNLKANYLLAKDIGVIYFLTQKGLTKLKEYWHREIFRDFPAPLNVNNLFHDLLLTETVKKLKESFNCEVLNTKVISLNQLSLEQIPDAILFNKNNKSQWAIELELTAKSNQRYREIISNYSTNQEFEKVLYIVKDEAIYKKIGGIISGYGKQFQIGDYTGKFQFLYLKEFLAEQKREVCNEL